MTEALLSLTAGLLGTVAGAGIGAAVYWLVYDLPDWRERRHREAVEAMAKDWWELEPSQAEEEGKE